MVDVQCLLLEEVVVKHKLPFLLDRICHDHFVELLYSGLLLLKETQVLDHLQRLLDLLDQEGQLLEPVLSDILLNLGQSVLKMLNLQGEVLASADSLVCLIELLVVLL